MSGTNLQMPTIEYPSEWTTEDGGTAIYEATGRSAAAAFNDAEAWAEAQDPERHFVIPPASGPLNGMYRLTVYEVGPVVVTPDNADSLGDFGQYRKKTLTKISNFTVPAGTRFKTPEGLHAEDEECRVAFDTQGGVYPIRESVFQESYEARTLPDERKTD